MSETKWTPGPWRYVENSVGGEIFGAGVVGQRTECELVWFETTDAEQDVANARLIAAAPELYEALENCRAYMLADAMNLATAHGVSDWKSTSPHSAEILDRAQAALAKARGETS